MQPANSTACVLAPTFSVPPHSPACLTVKADPPNSPKQIGLGIQHTPDCLVLYVCVHCLFDVTTQLRAEGYVNIRVLGGIYG